MPHAKGAKGPFPVLLLFLIVPWISTAKTVMVTAEDAGVAS